MGAGNSKQTSPDSQYVFAADSPVSFSSSVVNSLQSSPETDSVRSRNLELQIQSRVTSELERIRDQESARLASLTAELTPTDANLTPDTSSSQSLTEKITDAVTPSAFKEPADRSHDSVNKDVAELRAKLEKRQKAAETGSDAGVEKAKEGLVQCLRVNDRRPLDCWTEVEAFKREVARLEQRFVDRALR